MLREHPILDTVPLAAGNRDGAPFLPHYVAVPAPTSTPSTRVVVVMAREPERFVGPVDITLYRQSMATAIAPGKVLNLVPRRHRQSWLRRLIARIPGYCWQVLPWL